MNGALEQDIKQWADSRWPTRTLASRLRKLGEEVGELAEAVCDHTGVVGTHLATTTQRAAAQEAADCAIILSDICSLLGYSLSAVMREKFAEVQVRPVGGELREGVTIQSCGRPCITTNCQAQVDCICQRQYHCADLQPPTVTPVVYLPPAEAACPKCNGLIVFGSCGCGYVNAYGDSVAADQAVGCICKGFYQPAHCPVHHPASK